MKFDQVGIHHLRMKLKSSFVTSFGSIDTRDCLILEVMSDGITGYGECVADKDPGYSEETSSTAWHVLKDFLIPALMVQDISHPRELSQVFNFVRGNPMAKAGLEMALWDLYGKIEGRSLRELIGGEKIRVKVGVSIGIQKTPEKLVEVMGQYLDQGYQRIKIKIKPGRDREDVKAARSANPGILLQVDANSAYSYEQAESLRQLDEYGLLLIEQPLAEDDLWDHCRLQKTLLTPLCLDESIRSQRHARQAIEMGACKIINIKAGRVGGLSEALAIHNTCQELTTPVWCGGMLETGIGRAANLALASLPNFLLPGDISATERYYERDITQEIFTLNPDSTINVPGGPGLGVNLDVEAFKRSTLKSLYIRREV
jgi:O-succinylbenzoate synthase